MGSATTAAVKIAKHDLAACFTDSPLLPAPAERYPGAEYLPQFCTNGQLRLCAAIPSRQFRGASIALAIEKKQEYRHLEART